MLFDNLIMNAKLSDDQDEVEEESKNHPDEVKAKVKHHRKAASSSHR